MQLCSVIVIIIDNYRMRKGSICKIISKGVDVMNITISGKNIEITEGLKHAINEKLGKLERYFTPDTDVIVTLSVEKERQKIEVTIPTKKFDIKPMYPEDACVQMELLGHNFFVFCNAETEEVNVVYKRKGNTYGLIEPEA